MAYIQKGAVLTSVAHLVGASSCHQKVAAQFQVRAHT